MRHWAGKQCFNCINILNMVKNLTFLRPIDGSSCTLVFWTLHLPTDPSWAVFPLSPLLLIGHPGWNPCNTDHFSINSEPVPSTWRWRQLVPLNHQCHPPALHHATTVVYIIWMFSQSLTHHTLPVYQEQKWMMFTTIYVYVAYMCI
jgi:hypothetical protein